MLRPVSFGGVVTLSRVAGFRRVALLYYVVVTNSATLLPVQSVLFRDSFRRYAENLVTGEGDQLS